MRKLIDAISIFSFLLSLTMTGAVIYSYLYIKNPENIEKTKGFVKDEIQKMLPDLLPEIPKVTGGALPVNPVKPF